MGYIKEPDGVDFLIAPSSYTDEDREAISAYIREYKAKTKTTKGKIGKRTSKCKTITI